MRADAETRERVIQEAQRRLRDDLPTHRGELAAKFSTTERVVQDCIAVAKDRNERAAQSASSVTGIPEWRDFEDAVVRGCREAPVPAIVLDNLLRRLADLRRSF